MRLPTSTRYPSPVTPTHSGRAPRRSGERETTAVERPEDAARRPSPEQARHAQALGRRDRQVRAHELAHQSVGGVYAGAMTLDYTPGPEGRYYAVGGEVSIDTSAAADPVATLRKMRVVGRAALAPAEPSVDDRRVAAEAAAQARNARAAMSDATGPVTREGEYLARNEPGGVPSASQPLALLAFQEVAALARPERLARGSRLDLTA